MANNINISNALPQNTIGITSAIGQVQNSSTLQGNWNNPFTISLGDLELSTDPHVRKYQVLEIDEDLLALSSAWKRLRDIHKNGGTYSGIYKLTDKDLFDKVKEEDHEKAKEIRDYYSKKIMMWKLKGQILSKFRADMNTFIHTDGKIFKEDICPLVYRLPEFYEYDIVFDKLANEHNKIINQTAQIKVTKNLKLRQTFLIDKRHTKRKEYWFTDENDNLVTLSFTHDNPLLPLLDKSTVNPITIFGKFTKRFRDNVEYYVADKYSF